MITNEARIKSYLLNGILFIAFKFKKQCYTILSKEQWYDRSTFTTMDQTRFYD